MVAKVGSLFVDLSANSAAFAKDLGKARNSLKGFSAKTNKLLGTIDRAFFKLKKSAGKAFKSIFSLKGAIGVLAGSAGLGLLIKKFADFESGLTDVFTLLDKNTFGIGKFNKGIKQMSKDIKALRITSGKTFDDLNKGLFDLISAGIPAAKAIKTLKVATDLATAGATDTTTAVDGLTSALNAFQIDASRAEEVASKFFQAQKGGKTTIAELSQGFGLVAASAKAYGASLDEVLAATAAVTLAGVKTSQAFTGLNAVFANISKPTKDAKDEAKRLGIEFNTTALRAQGLAKFFKAITESGNFTNTTLEKLFSSVEAQKVAFALTGAQAEDFAKILANLTDKEKSLTSFTDALNIKLEATGMSFARFLGVIDVISVNIGEKLAPAFKKLSKTIVDAEPAITRTFESIVNFIDKAIQALTIFDDALKLKNIRELQNLEKRIDRVRKSLEKSPKGNFLDSIVGFFGGRQRPAILKELLDKSEKLRKQIEGFAKGAEKSTKALEAMGVEMDRLIKDQTPQLISGIDDLAKKYEDIGTKTMPGVVNDAEDAAKKINTVFENAAKGIQDAFTGLFESIFEGDFGIADFGKNFAKTFATTASNILSASLQPLIGGFLRNFGGGAPGGIANVLAPGGGGATAAGGGGGFGSILTSLAGRGISSIAGSIFGGGAAATTLPLQFGGGAIASAGGVAGAAGAGAAGFGAALAAAAPFAIAAIAIPLLIKAFSSKKQPLAGAVGVIGGGGDITGIQAKAAKTDTAGVKSLFKGLDQFLNQVAEVTATTLATTPVSVEVGRFGKEFRIQAVEGFAQSAEQILKRFPFDPQDADSIGKAMADLAVHLLKTSETSGSLSIALENIVTEGREAQDILNDLSFAAVFDKLGDAPEILTAMELAVKTATAAFDEMAETAERLGLAVEKVNEAEEKNLKRLKDAFDKGIARTLLRAIDPVSAALADLDDKFAIIRRDAFALGANLVNVEKLFAEERVAILEETGQAGLDISASLKISILSVMKSAQVLRDSLLVSESLGGLSKQERRIEAQKQFEAAKTGFLAGTVDFREVERTSTNLLDASMKFFSTTEGFYTDQAKVLDFLATIESGSFAANDNTSLLITEAQSQNTTLQAILTTLQGQLIESQAIADSKLLRAGDTIESITKFNKLNELPNQLVRRLKVQAGFDFSAAENQSRTFAAAVRQGEASGELFNQLIGAVGGRTQQFANGGVGSGFALAGERGAEMINLGRQARVMTSNQTMRAMNDNRDVVTAISRLDSSVRTGVQATADQTLVLEERLVNVENTLNKLQKQGSRAS